jgi:hypothetical protein
MVMVQQISFRPEGEVNRKNPGNHLDEPKIKKEKQELKCLRTSTKSLLKVAWYCNQIIITSSY